MGQSVVFKNTAKKVRRIKVHSLSLVERKKKKFEELDFDKNLCIIHDWKNWKDLDHLKFTVAFDAKCNNPVPYNLKSQITDKYQFNK